MRQIKSPMQMRREAERRGKPAPQPLGNAKPAERPPLASETSDERRTMSDWLGHMRTGRITVR